MRRIRDSLHKREPGGYNVEIRVHSTCLSPPPAEGCAGERSSVKNHLTARLYGLLILEWRSRTPWTGLTYWIGDFGVCVEKGRYLDTPARPAKLRGDIGAVQESLGNVVCRQWHVTASLTVGGVAHALRSRALGRRVAVYRSYAGTTGSEF